MRTIGIRDALREALHEEMARDDSVFVMGEDVIAHGGPYTVTQGIADKWPDRIFETPIAEAGIVGLGLGAAIWFVVAQREFIKSYRKAMREAEQPPAEPSAEA